MLVKEYSQMFLNYQYKLTNTFLFIHWRVAVVLLLPCALCDRIPHPLQNIDRTSILISTETEKRMAIEGNYIIFLHKYIYYHFLLNLAFKDKLLLYTKNFFLPKWPHSLSTGLETHKKNIQTLINYFYIFVSVDLLMIILTW